MTGSAIDTLRCARRLREAGVPSGQAEAMAGALGEEPAGNVVTTPDPEAAVAALRADLAALETRLTWRVPGGMAAIAGLAVVLLKLT